MDLCDSLWPLDCIRAAFSRVNNRFPMLMQRKHSDSHSGVMMPFKEWP